MRYGAVRYYAVRYTADRNLPAVSESDTAVYPAPPEGRKKGGRKKGKRGKEERRGDKEWN